MIFFAFLICGAGILWEANDFVDGNPRHPLVNPEVRVAQVRYDEFGDPYALPQRETVAVSSIWSGLVTQLGFTFVLALVIGCLIRSMAGGALVLLALVLFKVVLFNHGQILDVLDSDDTGTLVSFVQQWGQRQGQWVMFVFGENPEIVLAAGIGVIVGLKE